MSGFPWRSKKKDRDSDEARELLGSVDSPVLDGSEKNLGLEPSSDGESHKFQEDLPVTGGETAGAAPDSVAAEVEVVPEEAAPEVIPEEQSFVEADDAGSGDSGEVPMSTVDVAGDDAGAVPASDSVVAEVEVIPEEQSFAEADDAGSGDSGEVPIPTVDVAGDGAGAVPASDSVVAEVEAVPEEAAPEVIPEEQSFAEADDAGSGDSGEVPMPTVDVAGDDAGAAPDSVAADVEAIPEEAAPEVIPEELSFAEADDAGSGDSGEVPIPTVDVAGDGAGAVPASDSVVAEVEVIPEEAAPEVIPEGQSFAEADDAGSGDSGEVPMPTVDVAGDDAGAAPDSVAAEVEVVPEEAAPEVIPEEQSFAEADDVGSGDSGEVPMPTVDVAGDDAGAAPDSAVADVEALPEEAAPEVIPEELSFAEADDAGSGDSGEVPIPTVDVAGDGAGAVPASDSAVADVEAIPEEAAPEVIPEELSFAEADDAGSGDSGEVPIPTVDVAGDGAGAVPASDSVAAEVEEIPEEAAPEVIPEEQSFAEADDAGSGDSGEVPIPTADVAGEGAGAAPDSVAAEVEVVPEEAAPEVIPEGTEKTSGKVVPPDAVPFVPLLDPEKLFVELKCELGSIRTSLGEIGLLKPGMIVDLKKNLAVPVDLFVNRKLVARGEPVKLGEGLGIRIVSLSEKS